MTTQDSQSELRNAIEAYKRYPYGTKEYPHITGIELLEVVEAYVTTRVKEAIEEYKKLNHIGYAYEPGEVTENYIVLERVAKKGKNWTLRVMCRWCGNEMNRMTNKFSKRHIDCPSWGIHSKLTTTTNGKGE